MHDQPISSTQALSSLQNKRVLLGVTGGIAAYKSPDIVRRLRDGGAEVRVVMTRGASEFITPLTLQAVSGNRVHSDLLDAEAEAAMGHIELARWADAIVVAPATADALARFAAGRADDLLATLLRASDAPVLLAPAMNQAMWRDTANQRNFEALVALGYHSVGPESGSQACGDTGTGRMSEAVAIAEATAALFSSGRLSGREVVITAGPTRELIDPVRYLSNFSSGRMGFALATAAMEAGAKVTLISGPVTLPTPERVQRIDVVSAAEMLEAAQQHCSTADVFIASAAVADFRVDNPATDKIKKTDDSNHMTLKLVKNPDILATISKNKSQRNTSAPALHTVGFAAETSDPVGNAQKKLQHKQLDMIVANDVSRDDIGFASDDNEVTVLFSKDSAPRPIAKCSKAQLARQLISLIEERVLTN